MLLQLTSCHIRKTDVIFLVVLDNTDVCILNSNLCHWVYALVFGRKGSYNSQDYLLSNE